MLANNRAFWRALHSLSHPVSVAAILLLLINDHYLRIQHASWLTGKLGDFAWLVFAPFIAALFFALFVPRRMPNQERITGMLAFIAIGAWFALAKTVPAVHQFTALAWDGVVGWPGTLRMDATDLLTLPGLLVGWLIWRRAVNTSINLRPVAYAAFGFGLMGTLASSSSHVPDAGIDCLYRMDNSAVLYTRTEQNYERYKTYKSQDGGLTWVEVGDDEPLPEAPKVSTSYTPQWRFGYDTCYPRTAEIVAPNNPQIHYRFPEGGNIEKSTDGGKTWQVNYVLDAYYQESRYFYHRKLDPGYIVPGTYRAVYHPDTGNLIVTMGHDGVLVKTPDGVWHPVAVGIYHLIDISQFSPDIARNMLDLQLYLALTLCFLVLTTTMAFIRRAGAWRTGGLVVGWQVWVLMLFMFNMVDYEARGNYVLGGLIGLLMLPTVAIPLSLGAIWDVARNFRRIVPHILVACVLANAAFLFPLLLWTVGTVPNYYTAAFFSVLLTFTMLFALYVFYVPYLPKPDKEKRKNDAAQSAKDTDYGG